MFMESLDLDIVVFCYAFILETFTYIYYTHACFRGRFKYSHLVAHGT